MNYKTIKVEITGKNRFNRKIMVKEDINLVEREYRVNKYVLSS